MSRRYHFEREGFAYYAIYDRTIGHGTVIAKASSAADAQKIVDALNAAEDAGRAA